MSWVGRCEFGSGTWASRSAGRPIGWSTSKPPRYSGSTLTFYADRDHKEVMRRGGFVDGAITMADMAGDQPSLWQERVLLNEEFYRALQNHPVPLSEAALRAIGPRSMVLDIYIWLAYRLHALKNDVEVSWPSLYAQFGAGYGRLRDFRAGFIGGIELALAVYPEAQVSMGERGITLRPSRPAVSRA